LIAKQSPKVLVHTSSLQSPWELNEHNEWCDAVRKLGFGVTAPLQAELALRVGKAMLSVDYRGHFINACYPDVVNRLLIENGVPVVSGVGNVAILSALYQSTEDGNCRAKDAYLIAHHAHVGAAITGRYSGLPPMLLSEDGIRKDIAASAWLQSLKIPPDAELNRLTGATAAPLICALAGCSDDWHGHAPGPLGLVGGYPIIASTKGVVLDLPNGIALAEAQACHIQSSLYDGISIGQSDYHTPYKTGVVQERYLSDLLRNWSSASLNDRVRKLLFIREQLRLRQLSTAHPEV
jgi:hypothetical protein